MQFRTQKLEKFKLILGRVTAFAEFVIFRVKLRNKNLNLTVIESCKLDIFEYAKNIILQFLFVWIGKMLSILAEIRNAIAMCCSSTTGFATSVIFLFQILIGTVLVNKLNCSKYVF